VKELHEAAIEIARLMGGVALRWFGAARTGELGVETKGDGSPVTRADREAEEAARTWIEGRFPGAGIVGEEHGTKRADAELRFVLDPIDGTKTFVRGVPLWGSLVGVMQGDGVVAGAASYPGTGEILSAARGLGAWVGDRRARVSDVSDIGRATVLTTDETFSFVPARLASWRTLAKQAGVVRSWGDCYGYLLVATGRAEAMIDPILSPWDAAPFAVILPEAGGVITDWSGGEHLDSAIATNTALAARVRGLLGGGG